MGGSLRPFFVGAAKTAGSDRSLEGGLRIQRKSFHEPTTNFDRDDPKCDPGGKAVSDRRQNKAFYAEISGSSATSGRAESG